MRIRSTMGLWLTVAACAPAKPQGVTGDPASLTYAKDLGVDLAQMTRHASGLYVQDLTAGSGAEAVAGLTVTARYTGSLPDGKKFDSGDYTFALGGGQVIAGWDEGVAGMKVGGKRRLVIPPSLGYGAAGSGATIPPNAVLVFEIEVIGVH